VAEFDLAVREITKMQGIKAWTWDAVKEHVIKFDKVREWIITAGKGYHGNKANKANVAKATSG
jgi:hypothetical protein